ncbi:MAG: hypothetical protein HY855_10735 [Burkholderiales bacterium]|nr:hypothetical protein [Burkholderiales bacterium]
MNTRLARFLIVLLGLGLAVVLLVVALQHTQFTEPRREGPPALVLHQGEPSLWVVVKFQEQRHLARSRFSTRYHLELRCHDARTGALRWTSRLRSIGEHEGGHGAQGRILGQQDGTVWLFIAGLPVAVSAADGAVQGTGLDIARQNPALQALMPTEPGAFTFDRGLVLVAADARRYVITVPGYAAHPYRVADEQAFSRALYMSSRWNGGYPARDFLTPQARIHGAWLGLYTEAEARDAGDDAFGDKLKDPARTWRDDKMARRSLWTARIGRTRAFSEGAHDRLLEPTRLAGSPEFLQGGLLVAAGTRQALQPDGNSLLVLHQSRVDLAGRAQLTRLAVDDGLALRSTWSTTLPFAELNNRWQFPDRLLMMGSAQQQEAGNARWVESLAVVDLASGRLQGWNLTDDAPLPAR